MKLESLSMRSPTPNPLLARNVPKSFTVRMVCSLQKHMPDIHDQCEENAEAEFDFDMEEEIYTDCAYIPSLCQLRIKNQNIEKYKVMLSTT